jgi:DNA-binding NtrC family response regulator
VTDLLLDDGNGADVISLVSQIERGVQTIVLSADKKVITAIDCYNRGAYFFLSKPLDKQLFINIMRNSLQHFQDWHSLIRDHLNI